MPSPSVPERERESEIASYMCKVKIINHTHVRFSSKRCAPACRKQSSWLGMRGTCTRRCQTVLPCWWANRPPGCEIWCRYLCKKEKRKETKELWVMRERERESSMINDKGDPETLCLCLSLINIGLTLHTDGLPIEMPGDIRLRFPLHLTQYGSSLSLFDGHHSVLFGKRNFLCFPCGWEVREIQCKINESLRYCATIL